MASRPFSRDEKKGSPLWDGSVILLTFRSTSLRIATGLVRRGYALRYLQDRRIPMEVEFLLEKDGKVVPLEVKASNASTASLNRLLEREDIEFGYKFTSGNVGVAGKKITLPHYMVMFI